MPTYVVTDPATGRKVKLTGDTPPTDEDLDEIFSSLPAPKQAEVAAQAEPEPAEDPSFIEGLTGGFQRGVKQTLGGAAQKLAKINKSSIDSDIEKTIAGMQSGEIPMNQQTMGDLDRKQNEAVKLAKLLSGVEEREISDRQSFQELMSRAPVSALAGNIGGQMAALPIPGIGQAKLPAQMLYGGLAGAGIGAIQPTVGDEKESSAALLGGGVGAAVPAVLRPITSMIGGAIRAAKGVPSGPAAEAARFADEAGLPIMTTDVARPKTIVGRGAQSLGEKIPITGTSGPRAAQQAARVDELKNIGQKYGVPSEQEIVSSLGRKTNKLSAAAGKRYESIINKMGDQPIPLNNTVRAIDEQIAKYTQPGAAQNPGVINALKQFKDQVTAGDNNLSLLRQNRTLFRELIKGEDTVMSDSAKRANDAVYRAITKDMSQGVESAMGPKASEALKQVDGIWAREASELKNTKLKNIFSKGEIKPEEATKMLFSNDRSEAKTLYDALDTVGRQNARAAIIGRAVQKAGESPERFINEMKKLDSQSRIFFRGDDRKQLDGLVNYLNHTRRASESPVLTQTGMQNMVFGVPAGVLADFKLTGGMGTAGFATLGGMARVYESKPVRRLMLKMAAAPANSPEFDALARAFEQEASKAIVRAEEATKETEK